MIITISGKKQSGKDTVGKIIQYLTRDYVYIDYSFEQYFNLDTTKTFEIKKFADKLKDIVCLLIGCTREQLEDETFKNTELGEEWKKYVIENIYSKEIISPYFSTKEEAKQWEQSQEYYEDTGGYDTSIIIIKMTPRLLLQLLGTECSRNIIHPNIWVNSLISEYKIEIIPNENYGSNKTQPKNWIITKEYEHEYELDNSHLVYKDEVNVIVPNWVITDMRFPNELQAVKDRGGISIRVSKPIYTLSQENHCEILHESETALDNTEFDYLIVNDNIIEELIEKVKEILTKEKII
jgi:hypothetical protein